MKTLYRSILDDDEKVIYSTGNNFKQVLSIIDMVVDGLAELIKKGSIEFKELLPSKTRGGADYLTYYFTDLNYEKTHSKFFTSFNIKVNQAYRKLLSDSDKVYDIASRGELNSENLVQIRFSSGLMLSLYQLYIKRSSNDFKPKDFIIALYVSPSNEDWRSVEYFKEKITKLTKK